MQELQITMLGPRAVGKTSLLTSMYATFDSTIGQTDLQLTPDNQTSAILGRFVGQLKSLFSSSVDILEVHPEEAIGRTLGLPTELRSFTFGLGRKGKKPSLKFRFKDYPGGYHDETQSEDERKFLEDLIKNSVAVVLAIDAPALMEDNGAWHDYVNQPLQMTDLFRNGYHELNGTRLVILAPIKCEKYLQTKKSTTEFLGKLKEKYKNLLNFLALDPFSSKVAVVITPVQTLGSIVVTSTEVKNKEPFWHFEKISHDAQYNPKDTDQPLRYILRFLLRLHYESIRQQNPVKLPRWAYWIAEEIFEINLDQFLRQVINFLRDVFGVDEYLTEAVNTFAEGCKTSGEFEVIQGKELLNLDT